LKLVTGILTASVAITSTFTTQHLSKLLHPLFGSIPSELYSSEAYRTSIVSAALLVAALGGRRKYSSDSHAPAYSDQSLCNFIGAYGIALCTVPLLGRGLAVTAGDWLGPKYGPVLPLLLLGFAVNVTAMWTMVNAMVSTSHS
jgi:hypothetical protein